MDKGIYVAMTGAMLRMNSLDGIASNVANISTSGYKRSSFSARLYPLMEGKTSIHPVMYPDARQMTVFDKFIVDKTQGTLTKTGNPLDLAIHGEGFFVVDVKGQRNYTRSGSLGLDKEGFLVTSGGYKIAGDDYKPIKIGRDIKSALAITPDGTITADGNAVGKVKLVNLNDIKNVSESLYSGKETGAAKGDITQGSIESSNVNPMEEMVAMITAQREFQTLQQVIRVFDQLSQRTNSEIAKV
jgi:flagellar basal-body rod protein FlgF